MAEEQSAKDAFAELQRALGPAQTANGVITPMLAQGDNGKAILGYMACKIAAMLEDW